MTTDWCQNISWSIWLVYIYLNNPLIKNSLIPRGVICVAYLQFKVNLKGGEKKSMSRFSRVYGDYYYYY